MFTSIFYGVLCNFTIPLFFVMILGRSDLEQAQREFVAYLKERVKQQQQEGMRQFEHVQDSSTFG